MSACPAPFGWSVAIDALGDRALVGAPYDGAGAAWALTRAGTGWAEETPKLTGADGSGVSEFGYSTALALDGNDALIGGYFDDGGAGAAWHFARAGASWTQQGAKLTGSGAAGGSLFGWSAALSSDGSIALIGGPYDNSLAGAMWTFVPGASATLPRHGHPCRRRGRSQRGHRCRR